MRPMLFTLSVSLVCGTALAQQANVNLDHNPQKNTENLVPFSARLDSPDVRDDRTVTFRLEAPEARSVALAGVALLTALGQERPVPFQKGPGGVWSLTIGPLPPDMYVYHLVVDGVQVADPNNTVAGFTAMPPYSQLVVHGDAPAYYDARDVPHGLVTRHVYHSSVTNGERELYVYTPPGYDRAKTYPVLYLVGGSGDLPHNWIYDGRVNFILDNLLAEGKAVPMVIAIPNNQVVHRNHPQHAALTFATFERELRQHVIPLVEKHYSVRTDPAGRALSGLSMGGRHTMFVGFESLDLFASFGVLSAGDVESETSIAPFLKDPDVNKKVRYLFVGQGTEEAKGRMGQRCVALHEALARHGVRHEYYVGGHGGHDWATWRHLVHERFLPGLWRSEAPPSPAASAARAADAAEKYTFVIVHGATAGGWEWKRTGRFLSDDGHTVYRATLTGLGERMHLNSPEIDLKTHIEDVVNLILFEDLHDVVLTGHSYGGMVITGVMDRVPERIRHVVFLDAAVPEDGMSLWDLFGGSGPRDPSRFADGFMQVPWVKAGTPPPYNVKQSIKCFNQPVSYRNPAALTLPVTYVAFVPKDKSATERAQTDKSWQRAVARGWTIRTFPGGHVAQQEDPRGVATLMEQAVGDVKRPVVAVAR